MEEREFRASKRHPTHGTQAGLLRRAGLQDFFCPVAPQNEVVLGR